MRVSLNTVKQLIDFELPPVDELVRRINAQLGGVEEITDLGAIYKGIVIVKVVECTDHPDSDHLHVCKIDDGGVTQNVERDENDLVQVVCGAPNIAAEQFVAWLPPGSTVPASFDDADPFVLGSRNLRGVMSNGMIASRRELAIGDDHEGILVITEADLPQLATRDSRLELKPGMDFAKTFGLDDTIIDIENKMFTHRPDLFGQLGVAREIVGIFGQRFVSPGWYLDAPAFEQGDGLELTVFNESGPKVPRLMFVAMENVTIDSSPLWLQTTLIRWGSKPISNVVDMTNYIMLLTAQPTHAYDYDKLRGRTIGARMAKPGEKLPLLNGKTYELTEEDIVIADGEGAIGLGGIMGGGNSEVSAETKNVVLEVANFDMYVVRKSSMRHGVFTDALSRFNKGQSALQNAIVMKQLVEGIMHHSGAAQASEVFDIHADLAASPVLTVDSEYINQRLGLKLTGQKIAELLTNVEFDLVDAQTDIATRIDELGVPFWRTDIEQPEDIVEEVGRLYGFDKLPQELPVRSIKPAAQNPYFEMRRKIGQILSGAGANEVKTYSFVHERVLKNVGQDPEQAYRLGNALSPDLQYYRLSLLPSLLDKVHMNIKAGHDEFALFEFGKAHRRGDVDETGLPREYPRLAFVYAAKKPVATAFYMARHYAETIAPNMTYMSLKDFDASKHPIFEQLCKPFDPERAAVLMNGETFVGVVGEFSASVIRAFKLPEGCAGIEMFQSHLAKTPPAPYKPLSRFPYVTQDISLHVSKDTPYAAMLAAAQEALHQVESRDRLIELSPLDIYEAENGETKTFTFRLKATDYERTLTDKVVTTYIDQIASAAAEKLHAEKV